MNTHTLISAEAPYAAALLFACLLVIFGPLKSWRRSLTNTLIFFAACVGIDILAGNIDAQRFPFVVRSLREFAVIGEGLSVIRYLGLAMFRVVLPRLHINISGILGDILIIIGYIGWGLIRLNMAGVEFTHLFATSAVMTAVLAFAMQDTLGNLLGGLALQMDNSLEIGDWIKLDDMSGVVVDIQWRYTALRTRNGEIVVIPNSQLMKSRYALLCDKDSNQPYWRRMVNFNVDLAFPPARVIATVLDNLQSAHIPNVSNEPPPTCVLMDFGSGYGAYTLRYWLTNPLYDDVTDSEVRTHILAALQRAGMRLAISDQKIHLVKEGESHREEVRAREMKHRLDAIRNIELFRLLSEEEQHDLAQRLIPAPFARGDIMIRQGAVAHWLYIIVSGEAEAWWQPPEGPPRLHEKRGAGTVFGELGLMTGAPRRASVTAVTDVEAYRLDKEGFEKIIRARPELANSISILLKRRLDKFDELEKGYSAAKQATQHDSHNDLGQKILDFFGIGKS